MQSDRDHSIVTAPNMANVTIPDLLKLPQAEIRPDRLKFTFQHPWFDQYQLPEWEKRTVDLLGRKLNILEIGSFEGASTTWMMSNLMKHPESRITVIDTFEGGLEHQHETYDLASLEDRFRANVNKCESVDRLRVIKARSDDALLDLHREKATFDFIYIDGSHIAIDVLFDAVICWKMLNQGGTLVFDDVAWKGYMEDCYNPRIAITSFVQIAEQELEATETATQMWVRKVPNHIPATANSDPTVLYWDKRLALKLLQEAGYMK